MSLEILHKTNHKENAVFYCLYQGEACAKYSGWGGGGPYLILSKISSSFFNKPNIVNINAIDKWTQKSALKKINYYSQSFVSFILC